METIPVNFRCPKNLLALLDEAARKDHRDRSGMLIKILADRLGEAKPKPKPAKKPAPKKR